MKTLLPWACVLSWLFAAFPAAGRGQGYTTLAPVEAMRHVTRVEHFGSWGYSCEVAGDNFGVRGERCMVSQTMAGEPGKSVGALGLAIDFADSDQVPTLRARISGRAVQEAGIGIKIDNNPGLQLTIGSCDRYGCEAAGAMGPDVVKYWRKGKIARVAYVHQGGKRVVLSVSLAGFDRALDALLRHKGRPVPGIKKMASLNPAFS